MRLFLPALLVALLPGCDRLRGAPPDGGLADASSPAPPDLPTLAPASAEVPPTEAPPAPRDETEKQPRSPVEAARRTLHRLDEDRALAAHEELLRKHFGPAIPVPLELQEALLAGDRRATLLYGAGKERNPFILFT